MAEKIKMIQLRDGVEISHKKKVYRGEIPEELFNEIYGNLGKDEAESKKLYEAKLKKVKPEAKPKK